MDGQDAQDKTAKTDIAAHPVHPDYPCHNEDRCAFARCSGANSDWNIEEFAQVNVVKDFMHPLAEAAVPTGQSPANATYSYLALDNLSSARAVFSQTKAQTGALELYPYGQRLSTSGTLPYNQFTAKPYDTEDGLYYFPYRYYSPGMDRWTSADPAGTVDGPNVYRYVGDDPVNHLDSLGLDQWRCDGDSSWLNFLRCLGTRNSIWAGGCDGCCWGPNRDPDCQDDAIRRYIRRLARCMTTTCIVRARQRLEVDLARCLDR